MLGCSQDADSTDIYQISRNWADLVKRARAKQLAPDEYNSGNFTISNLGMFGADKFDAILPPGIAAVLACHPARLVLSSKAGHMTDVGHCSKACASIEMHTFHLPPHVRLT